MHLHGTVSSGLGRAHVFMAQLHYQEQFRDILGQTAWPGTLNVTVKAEDLPGYIALRQKAGIDTLDAEDSDRVAAAAVDVDAHRLHRVRGFLRDGVSFGGASAYTAVMHANGSEVPCAILIPDLTRHVDVIEIIAPVFLREHLDLTDGDSVTISL